MAALPAENVVPLRPEAAGAELGVLFEQHGRMVYGLCRLLLRDSVEAEDAAQEAFLSAHKSLLSGNEPRDPRAWLAAIARNECRARIRARMMAPLSLIDEAGPRERDAAVVAGERAELRAVCAAVADLPPQQRDAIVLREFYGLSYEEAAAALGVSHANFETLLHRGRAKLQASLRPAQLAQGALVVPIGLKEALAAAVPGFGASTATSAGGAGFVAALVAKVATAPIAAKIAAATAAVSVATTGTAAAISPVAREALVSVSSAVAQTMSPAPPQAAPSEPRQEDPAEVEESLASEVPAEEYADEYPYEFDRDDLWSEDVSSDEPVYEEPPPEEWPVEEAPPAEEPPPDPVADDPLPPDPSPDDPSLFDPSAREPLTPAEPLSPELVPAEPLP